MLSDLSKTPTSQFPLIIAGPTAIGKSSVAQYIAEQTGALIISADSMLVYKGMDIGTAKPSKAEREAADYIGLDCVYPDERFSVGDWMLSVKAGLAGIDKNRPIIVVGGTGLYIKALLNGLDEEPFDSEVRAEYQRLFETEGLEALQQAVREESVKAGHPLIPESDSQNPRRLIRALERLSVSADGAGRIEPLFPAETPVYCLTMDREMLASRISKRIDIMFEDGLVEEAKAIASLSETASGGIGYKEALALDRGEMTLAEAKERIAARTRQLAKRQFTWFKHQLDCRWTEITPEMAVPDIAEKLLIPENLS